MVGTDRARGVSSRNATDPCREITDDLFPVDLVQHLVPSLFIEVDSHVLRRHVSNGPDRTLIRNEWIRRAMKQQDGHRQPIEILGKCVQRRDFCDEQGSLVLAVVNKGIRSVGGSGLRITRDGVRIESHERQFWLGKDVAGPLPITDDCPTERNSGHFIWPPLRIPSRKQTTH